MKFCQARLSPPLIGQIAAEASLDAEDESTENTVLETEIEEIQVVTKLVMPSRKLKIKISNELLQELERMQINFKLN